jgi:hypothetical protein
VGYIFLAGIGKVEGVIQFFYKWTVTLFSFK